MASITIELKGDSEGAVKAFADVIRAQQSLQGETKKSRGDVSGFGDSAAGAILKIGSAMGGMSTALGLIRSDFSEWKKDLEGVANAAGDYANKMRDMAAATGDDIDKISAKVKELMDTYKDMTKAEATALYGAVREAMPRATQGRAEEAIGAVAKYEDMGAKFTGIQARVVGAMEESGAFKGMSMEDMAKMAGAMIQGTGGRADILAGPMRAKEWGRMGAAGVSPDEIARLSVAEVAGGQRGGVASGILESIEGMTVGKRDITKAGSPLDGEILGLQKMSGTEQLEYILGGKASPELLGKLGVDKLTVQAISGARGRFDVRSEMAGVLKQTQEMAGTATGRIAERADTIARQKEAGTGVSADYLKVQRSQEYEQTQAGIGEAYQEDPGSAIYGRPLAKKFALMMAERSRFATERIVEPSLKQDSISSGTGFLSRLGNAASVAGGPGPGMGSSGAEVAAAAGRVAAAAADLQEAASPNRPSTKTTQRSRE